MDNNKKINSTTNDSLGWGIEQPDKDIRIKAFEYLHDIKAPACLYYNIPAGDLLVSRQELEESEYIRNIFEQGCKYFISLEPGREGLTKEQSPGIKNIDDMVRFISGFINDDNKNDYNVSLIEEIQYVEGSFNGTAISDGRGKLVIEVLYGTTDARKMTRTGASSDQMERVFFSDFNSKPFIVPKKLSLDHLMELKKLFHYHPGFFKFIYGTSRGKKQIWVNFSSRNPKYMNGLQELSDFSADMIERMIRNLEGNRVFFDDKPDFEI